MIIQGNEPISPNTDSYTLSFNANGGSGSMSSISVTYGNQFTLPANTFTRNGYSFQGWNVKRNGDNKWYVNGQGWLTESQISSGGYSKAVYANKATKTFDDSWTKGYSGKSTYTFYAVWQQSTTSTLAFENDFKGPSGDYPTMTNFGLRGTITSNYNITQIYAYVKNTETNAIPSGFSYTKTWSSTTYNIQNDGLNNAFSFGNLPAGSYTYYVEATDSSGKTVSKSTSFTKGYKIVFNANGGSGAPANQWKLNGAGINLSTTRPTRANGSAGSYTVTLNANGGSVSPASLSAARTTSYSFKNWNTASNGGGTSYNPGASYTANAALTLYAQWNSSTSTAAVNLPTPTREGYSFLGWATSASASEGVTGNYTPNANVTLYALWETAEPLYYLDLNGYLDENTGAKNIEGYGTVDIYINGSKVADDVADYCLEAGWPAGTQYEITDIKTAQGKHYWGVTEGSLSGTIDGSSAKVSARLHYSTFYSGPGDDLIIPNGLYQIAFGDSGLVFGVAGDGSNGSNVELMENQHLASQIFNICMLDVIPYRYAIKNVETGRALNITEKGTAKRTNIQVWDYTNNLNAQWVFQSAGDGCYNIIAHYSSMYIDIPDGVAEPGNNVWIFTGNGSDAQKFQLIPLPDSYDVCLDPNGGQFQQTGSTEAIHLQKVPGEELDLDAEAYELSREGYTFLGWAASASAESGFQGAYLPTGDVTLYALWAPETFTVSYDANGGEGAPAAQTKTYDVPLILSSDEPTKSDVPAHPYTVTLDANGGTVDPDSLEATRTTSFIFDGWNTASNGSGQAYASDDSYTENTTVTLYAQWSEDITTSAVNLPTPTYAGHSFLGWAESINAESGDVGEYIPTDDVTLYAIWQADTYTVAYDANGGENAPAAQTKTAGEALTLTSDKPTRAPTFEGSFTVTLDPNGGSCDAAALSANIRKFYSFYEWNTAADASGTRYAPGGSYEADADVTLYAQWSRGINVEEVELPTPTRDGFAFKGWATSANAASGVTGSYMPSDDVTLYALWEEIPVASYTVTYNANGGTGAPAKQTKTHGTALKLSNTKPTRADASAGQYTVTLNANGGSVDPTSLAAARTTKYTFKNWNTAKNGSGTSYNAGASYTADAAVTLYAQWNSTTTTAAVNLPTPTRAGYTFKGWATSSTATSGTTGSYTPSGNVTLYAIWQADTYTVSYDANGGTGAPSNQTKTQGTALKLSGTKPTRADASAGQYTVTLNANGGSVDPTSLAAARTTKYTFKNWNTAKNGSGTSYNAGASYTADAAVTLYAQWNSTTTTAAVNLPTPTRTGYTFKGWAASADAASGVTGSYTPDGNVTLYALWQLAPSDLRGWVKVNGDWYYYDDDGFPKTNAWMKDSVGWCYLGEDGRMLTNTWKADSKGTCYLDKNGRMVKSKWIQVDGSWYYIDAKGYRTENAWAKDSKGWCYLKADGRMAVSQWVHDGDYWYYMNGSGYMVTGWQKIGGTWYYFKNSGKMVANGWAKDTGGWRWMDANGKITKSKWIQDGDDWYYLNGSGYMVTGTQTIGGKTYHFASNGVWIP